MWRSVVRAPASPARCAAPGRRPARAGRRRRCQNVRVRDRVAREVRLEQVNAPAMERHHRRVGRLEAVLDVHLQDAVLGGRVPAVGPEEVLHGVPVDYPRARRGGHRA